MCSNCHAAQVNTEIQVETDRGYTQTKPNTGNTPGITRFGAKRQIFFFRRRVQPSSKKGMIGVKCVKCSDN